MKIDVDVNPLNKLKILHRDRNGHRRVIIRTIQTHYTDAPYIDFISEPLQDADIAVCGRRQFECIRDRINKEGKVALQCRININSGRIGQQAGKYFYRIERINLGGKEPYIDQTILRGPGAFGKINRSSEAGFNCRRRKPVVARIKQNYYGNNSEIFHKN